MRIEAYKRMFEVQNKHWWFIGKGEIVEQMIINFKKRKKDEKTDENKTLLDVGCGCGAMLSRLDKFGEVYGADFSEEALEFSAMTFPNNGRIKRGWLPDGMPFDDGRFDVITALDVLEHIDDDKGSALKLLELLAPGGLLIVTVPANMSLWSNHDVVLEHKRRYVKKELAALFPIERCSIRKISYFNSVLFPPIYLIRKLNNIFRPNRLKTDDELPGAFLNSVLLKIMRLENRWLKNCNFPFGVSILAVIEKNNIYSKELRA